MVLNSQGKQPTTLKEVMSYVYQLEEQLRYALNNIDGENIADGTVTDKQLSGQAVNALVSAVTGSGDWQGMNTKIIQNAKKIELKANKGDPATSLETSGITIQSNNVNIKSGGTFTVDSGNFDLDEKGELSASNVRLSGEISVGGHNVWHEGNIIVSTAEPVNPPVGALWVLPDMTSIPAAGTWTMDALPARPWENPYDAKLTGANIGAAPSGAEYIYSVSVPVYHKWENDDPTTCTVYLGASKGAKTINMGAQSFTDSGTYKATLTSSVWLGNSGTIYMRVHFSSGSNMSVNSHSPLSCTLKAKSQAATGWKACDVQMYTG